MNNCPKCEAKLKYIIALREMYVFECGTTVERWQSTSKGLVTETVEGATCVHNQYATLKKSNEHMKEIIDRDYKSYLDQFYDDPRNSGHKPRKHPLE